MSTASETPAKVEAEAEEARAGLVGTLSQLRENLKPANVMDEVMHSAKVNASALTDQAWETAKRNPLPALLIGTGLAMIFGFGTKYGLSGSGTASDRRPGPRQDHGYESEFRSHIARAPARGSARSSLNQQASGAMASVAGRASELFDSANDRLSEATSRGASAAGDAYAAVKRSGPMSLSRRNVGSSLSHLIEEQPLILAAVGVAIGAALGAALPQTETENSLMGETSGSLRNAAQKAVQDQFSDVKAAATHAVEDIKQTVAEHGVTTDNLSGLVRDIGEKAKSATYEAGRTVVPET